MKSLIKTTILFAAGAAVGAAVALLLHPKTSEHAGVLRAGKAEYGRSQRGSRTAG